MKISSTNFREVKLGKIAPNVLYRSNHPICNGKQVKEIILCANNANIKTILNLSDNTYMLRSKVICSPWYNKMFKENNVIAVNIPMNFDILENKFIQKLGQCIIFMIEHKPPYLVHCEVGIDRTGFLSILLESFMGAEFNDIVKDYMLSFVNDDEFSENDYKTGSLFILNLFTKINGNLINNNDNLKSLSKKYLMEKVGLNNDELRKLENKLMKKDM
jgi:protein tyrosine/serine phosphatase